MGSRRAAPVPPSPPRPRVPCRHKNQAEVEEFVQRSYVTGNFLNRLQEKVIGRSLYSDRTKVPKAQVCDAIARCDAALGSTLCLHAPPPPPGLERERVRGRGRAGGGAPAAEGARDRAPHPPPAPAPARARPAPRPRASQSPRDASGRHGLAWQALRTGANLQLGVIAECGRRRERDFLRAAASSSSTRPGRRGPAGCSSAGRWRTRTRHQRPSTAGPLQALRTGAGAGMESARTDAWGGAPLQVVSTVVRRWESCSGGWKPKREYCTHGWWRVEALAPASTSSSQPRGSVRAASRARLSPGRRRRLLLHGASPGPRGGNNEKVVVSVNAARGTSQQQRSGTSEKCAGLVSCGPSPP